MKKSMIWRVFFDISHKCTNFAVIHSFEVMQQTLTIYNTLTRRKEPFVPLHAPNVGM